MAQKRTSKDELNNEIQKIIKSIDNWMIYIVIKLNLYQKYMLNYADVY